MKFGRILAIITLSLFSLNSHADERVIMRTQWRTANINEPNISYFHYLDDGSLHMTGGVNLKEHEILKDENGNCINFLTKLTHYPLKKMLERHYIDDAQYTFYRKFAGHVQGEQVVFFNVAIPKVPKPVEIRYISLNPHDPFGMEDQISKTLMENFAAFGQTHLSDEKLLEETSKMLETQASMWMVRNFVEEAPGKLIHKKLPWQIEENFADVVVHPGNGLMFELGRVASEKPEDAQTLFRASVLTAANDVMITGKNLAESKVYAHAITPIHIRYYKNFGFEPVKTLPNGEALLEVNLEKLFRQLNPIKDYQESKSYLAFFNDDPVKALKFRNKIRSSFHQVLEPAKGKKPLIMLYNNDWHAHAAEELFGTLNEAERMAFRYNSSNTPDVFTNDPIPKYFHSSKHPGNRVYGLDPAELAADPEYVEKTVAGLYVHALAEMYKNSYSAYFAEGLVKESSTTITTADATIMEAARKAGAEVHPVSYEARNRIMNQDQLHTQKAEGYELTFTANQVHHFVKKYHLEHKIPKLDFGISHQQYLRMNGL